MDKGIMAARRQLALEKITGYTGKLNVQKTRTTELKELFTLEAIAAHFEDGGTPVETVDEDTIVATALVRVFGISGVGPAVEGKIREEFDEVFA